MMNEGVFQVLVLVSLGIVAVLVKYSIPSYLSEKGKNLATKEDISDITQKIESIKAEHLKEVEKLKSDLQFSIGQQAAYHEHRRQALQQFFESCMNYLDILSQNPGDLPIDDGKSLHEYGASLRREFSSIYRNYHRLLLYFDSSFQVVVSAEQVAEHARALNTAFREGFPVFKVALMKEGEIALAGSEDQRAQAITLTDKAAGKLWEGIGPRRTQMFEAFRKYIVSLNSYLRSQGSRDMKEMV